MKKLLTLLLTLVFVFLLSACDNNGGERVNNNTPTNSQTATEKTNNTTNSITNNDTTSKTQTITRDRAIEHALNHAGLTQNDVYDLEAELDRERDGKYWEVDFESGGFEYSYDINAETGETKKIEKERD